MSKCLLILLVFSGLAFSSCSKSQATSVQTPTSPDSTYFSNLDSTFFYYFSLDGVTYVASGLFTTSNSYHTGGFGEPGYVCSEILPQGVSEYSGPSIPDTTAFQEIIGNVSLSGTSAAFYDSLSPKSIPYGKNVGEGVVITWVDRQAILWSTILGSADQSGSNFSITASNYDNIDIAFVDVLATFNCKLYDSAGDVKTLTNGHTRLPFLGP